MAILGYILWYTINANYLWQKRGVFYFVRHVPNDVQKHYERPRIVICLKTNSKTSSIKG